MPHPEEKGFSFANRHLNFHSQKAALSNCDREPIHIPGSIQPHGYLIAFSEAEKILYLSENVHALVGLPASQLLGKSLEELLEVKSLELVREARGVLKHKHSFSLPLSKEGELFSCEALLHRQGNSFILELEPVVNGLAEEKDLTFLNDSFERLQEARNPEELAQVLAGKLKELSNFDRVMVYRFKPDFSGEVIAEARAEHMDSFLGLHFPASDIPAQARALYLQNPIRLIPDIAYKAVAIVPSAGQESTDPLDLSDTVLRSVSPVHLQYLQNMNVKASMSISLIRDHQLWGLIACHHSGPLHIGQQCRQMGELLARAFVMVLGEKEQLLMRGYQEQLKEVKMALFNHISRAEKPRKGLYEQQPNVQDLVRSGGCIISFGTEYIRLGSTPEKEEVLELIRWLQKTGQQEVYYTHALASLYPPAKHFRDTGSGIMAIAVSHIQQEYIIWFRPELVRSVRWAGRPDKQTAEEGTEEVLTPRASFEAWEELVQEQAEPWLPEEIEAAKDLRAVLVEAALKVAGELKLEADILSRIHKEVNSDKSELDSFAYIVSHDLKEPLRGIHNYASFVLEDYGHQLEADGKAKLQTLMRLSKRMQQLIESLLHFSRMGRMELHKEEVDMGKVVEGVLDIFGQELTMEEVQLKLPEHWPRISCDELRVSEVWMNLVSNGLKYNDKALKELQLGYRAAKEGEVSPSGYVFFVQDNGIGVGDRYQQDVFNLFRRLHGRDAYGGGTGAGLTIVKKIVERHGGVVWLDSKPGKGTTFLFSL